jgi:hypothetical protein
MSSDDGGPGTGSASVRRSRFNRGTFADLPAWRAAGACLPAATLLFKVVVFDGVPAWRGAGFLVPAATFLSSGSFVLSDVRTCPGDGFRLVAAGFLVFSVFVPVVLITLVPPAVRDRAFGRLAERRSAGDFLVAFAILPPRRAARLAMLRSLSVTLTVLR